MIKMTKMITKVAILFFVVASFASCTIEKPAEPEKSITVTGSASVPVKADMISMTFRVRTIGWNVNQTVENNANITTKVIDAIKNVGVDTNDITTVDYNISQDMSHTYPGQYTVINSVKVLIRNPEITGNVIDTAVVNGANGLTSYEYLAGDKTTALRQARTQAIQNAQDAANLLAGVAGTKVGNVMEINENYSTDLSYGANFEVASYSGSSTPIQEGYVQVQSTVTVRYSLE